ncbi:MAG: AMP-binding protein, partial [Cyclobacteriaceae bacterium]|nr:AMP-binding protein [Cyclobacteriaceae bacterium]
MRLHFKEHKLIIDHVNIDESVKKNLPDEVMEILHFLQDWQKGAPAFTFQTSGSTGNPKTITINRTVMEYSARNSLAYLGIPDGGASLLCISPRFIGGKMAVLRAFMHGLTLDVVSPTSNFQFVDKPYLLTSLVPMQLESLAREYPEKLPFFKTLLIGGAPISPSLEYLLLTTPNLPDIYATYGMTETASHIALRKLGDAYFRTIGDIQLETDHEGCLRLKGTVTSYQWLQTHDKVALTGSGKFQWLGRRDFVINSGGYKLIPEHIERKLASLLAGYPFMVSSVPDERLGEKLALVFLIQPP